VEAFIGGGVRDAMGMNFFSLSKKGVYRGGKVNIAKCDVGLENESISVHAPDRMGQWVIGNGKEN
jgi:hypothetical protein